MVTGTVRRYSESDIPTEYGPVRVVVYRVGPEIAGCPAPEEHMALIVGKELGPVAHLPSDTPSLARVHSECWTGEVLHSRKCECREQLDGAIRAIVEAGGGVVIYLRQEGRGIGLGNKIRAYALQERGHDTVDANRLLGFGDDDRTYDVAAAMLADLGVKKVALLTNNPRKVDALVGLGMTVERVPLSIPPNEHNAGYLAVKASRLGHTL